MARSPKSRPRRLRGALIGAVVVGALGGGVWLLSQNISGVSRPAAVVPTVNLLPPPPPPPPPPPQPKTPPPPEKSVEEPRPEPAKADNQPKPITMNGPAQAGGDAFGIGAGKGGGSVVGGSGEGGPASAGGFAEASYGHFLSSEIQQAVQSNPRIDRLFNTADVAVWMAPSGKITRARIRRSSGNDKIDSELVATLERMRPLSQPPPAGFRFPREVTVKGVRG